jgi:DNA repair protein RecN (Recombination protein N)
MLDELRVQNFAIIDSLEMRFAPGLNVITGETGAGKSIIIDAVDLLLGGKADASFIRAGADKTVIEGVFKLDPPIQALLQPVLEAEELTGDDPGFITLTREVRSSGRSTARVNGVTVNLDVLARIGALLVDVHGQNEHMSLFRREGHIDLLDRYAGLMEARVAMGVVVHRLNDVRREIRQLQQDEAALKRRAEMLRHEVELIEASKLEAGEDEELRAERNRLSHSEKIAEYTSEIMQHLSGDDRAPGQLSAVDQLNQVAVLLGKLVAIDPDLKAEADLAETLSTQVQELVFAISNYVDEVEYEPGRLDEVEERLELILSLQRRLGVASLDAILAYAKKATAELETLENSEERLAELQAQEEKLLHSVGEVGVRISQLRQAAGAKLAKAIVTELGDLRMGKAVFEVSVLHHDDSNGCYVGERRLKFDEMGIDDVEFMMSANPGEPLRPLAKVASGGEAARIMLALKRVLTQADQTPTLIFDEIDQGIGGRVGSVVGEKLWGLTGQHQVLVVTHLAQLAGFADRHYRVEKRVEGKRTVTMITPLLDEDERVIELAAMLGTSGDSGRQSARELIFEAQTHKETHAAPNGQPNDAPSQQTLF